MLLVTGLLNLIQGQDGHDTLSGMPKQAFARWPASVKVHHPEKSSLSIRWDHHKNLDITSPNGLQPTVAATGCTPGSAG